jgi:regulator of replication initiation timing
MKREQVVVRDKNNAFGDQESELMELQRRISTLTAALSEKAEENLDLRAELEQRGEKGSSGASKDKRLKEQESDIQRLKQERDAQVCFELLVLFLVLSFFSFFSCLFELTVTQNDNAGRAECGASKKNFNAFDLFD